MTDAAIISVVSMFTLQPTFAVLVYVMLRILWYWLDRASQSPP